MSAPKSPVLIRAVGGWTLLVLAGLLLVLMDYPDRGFSFRTATENERPGRPLRTYELIEASRGVSLLGDHYAFQARLQPRRMLLGALHGIEDRFDRFLVEPSVDLAYHAGEGDLELTTITIRFRDQRGEFAVGEVADLYQMAWKLMEIFDHFQPEEELSQDLEEAAIEGMLSVLDPHTNYLSPEQYNDMRMSTQGSFGGLGIVISVRDGRLQVVSVMAGTPASGAALEKGDHIVQIDDESTVNMMVSEAAKRLRGKPGTKVKLTLEREGMEMPFAKELTREIIKVKSVLAQDLNGQIAYVRVKGFQTNSAQEVYRWLGKTYPEAPPAGIILDLRGNSGGVMSAAVELADLFLEEGTVVDTVARVREGSETEPSATGDRYEKSALVVLTDHGSASASEIVTGALKYRDRALVIGNRTFGKGSVQYIHELDRGALKMTVAQYVGPQMEVIQGQGIEPHIEVRAIHPALPPRMPAFYDEFEGEGALPYSLERTGALPVFDGPERFLLWVPEEADPEDIDQYDQVVVDLPVKLAWSILAFSPSLSGAAMLAGAEDIVSQVEEYEESLIDSLAWTEDRQYDCPVSEAAPAVSLAAHMSASEMAAGEEGTLTVSVTNRGDTSVCRLVARTESTNLRFDGGSCLLGTVAPGETIFCDMVFKTVATSPRRKDLLFVDLHQGLDLPLATTEVSVSTVPTPLPRLAMSYQIIDRGGNGDNTLQAGEDFALELDITNIGAGPLTTGLATLKNLSGPAIFLSEGRTEFTDLAPGKTTSVTFSGRVQGEPKDEPWKLELGIVDMTNRTHYSATTEWTVLESSEAPRQMSRFLQPVRDGVPVRVAPDLAAASFGILRADGGAQVVAEHSGWFKLQLPGRRWGWCRRDDLEASVRPELALFEETYAIVQPEVRLDAGTSTQLMGDARTLVVSGTADFGPNHPPEDAGVAVYRNGRKVALDYRGNGPWKGHELAFRFEVALEDGVNRILISAFSKNQSPGYASVYYNRVDGRP